MLKFLFCSSTVKTARRNKENLVINPLLSGFSLYNYNIKRNKFNKKEFQMSKGEEKVNGLACRILDLADKDCQAANYIVYELMQKLIVSWDSSNKPHDEVIKELNEILVVAKQEGV